MGNEQAERLGEDERAIEFDRRSIAEDEERLRQDRERLKEDQRRLAEDRKPEPRPVTPPRPHPAAPVQEPWRRK